MYDSNFAEGYAIGRDSNSGYNNGFGGDWAWWIVILLIFGWGNGNGFGGYGNGGAGLMASYATQADLQRGFDTQGITNKLNGLENGLCDGFYAQNTNMLNGFAGVQNTLCQGFSGVTSAVTNGTYETKSAITDLGYRLQDCCCQTQRAIDGVNYNLAKNTCDIIQAGNNNTQRVIDFLTGEKITSLQAENAALTAQLSNNAQTRTLIDALRPQPVPAFPASQLYGYCSGACGNGCGC